MELSRLGYNSEFMIYPVLIVVLFGSGLSAAQPGTWLTVFVLAIAAWTLIEYLLHRFVFHELPYIRDLHARHHADQRALLGTPLWVSLLGHGVLGFVPAFLLFGFGIASAISAGLMSGYLWYICAHHAVHHWPSQPGSYLYGLRHRHALHHHHDTERNFGVTSGFWDRVLGTDDHR